MAHLVRPWTYRYLDKDGKRVPKGTPGARKVKQKASKWYGAGIPGLPKTKRVPLATDKRAAQQLLAALVRKAERGEAGLEDGSVAARRTPLAGHLADFERHLHNKPRGVSDKQVKLLLTRLRTTFDACDFKGPGDLNLGKVLDYLAERRRLPNAEGGISIQTSNFYLSALNQFGRWMCSKRERRLLENPFAEVERGNVELDRRHDRRNLSPAELSRVLDAVKASAWTFRGLTGTDRYFLYYTACGTGFRAEELSTLTPEAFDLGALPPTVTLAARRTKNKKPVVQPLPAGLAADLGGHLKGRPAGRSVWPGTWWEKAATMLRHDLEAVGIDYVVEGADGPLYADFHALRHSYITWLEQAGVTPATAKELARHSDIRLTLDRYTHSNLTTLAAAVDKLPLPNRRCNDSPQGVEALAIALVLSQTVLGVLGIPCSGLVAPLVAADSATTGDGPGQEETEPASGSSEVDAA
jgi:integrase